MCKEINSCLVTKNKTLNITNREVITEIVSLLNLFSEIKVSQIIEYIVDEVGYKEDMSDMKFIKHLKNLREEMLA